MALDKKEILTAFFAQVMEGNKDNLLAFIDFYMKPQNEQRAAIQAFIQIKLAEIDTALAGLDNQRAAAEISLNTQKNRLQQFEDL